MNIKIIEGSLFDSECQTVVNSVNCVGVMGKGIALEFRLRHPAMYEKYVEICREGLLDIGQLWVYKNTEQWILNFPTKKHWKYPTKIEYLELGLQKFLDTYEKEQITSVAFPLLGTENGKLDKEVALDVMKTYLHQCNIYTEIYLYRANCSDRRFEKIKQELERMNSQQIAKLTGLSTNISKTIKEAMQESSIKTATDLLNTKGIGHTSVEKIFKVLY